MSVAPHINVGASTLVIKDGKVLLGRRKNSAGAGDWGFPGGHVEPNENITETAKREVLEETGLTVNEIHFVGMINQPLNAESHKEAKHYIQTVFYTDKFHGEATNMEPDSCEGWEWFPIEQLPDNIFFAHKDFMSLYLSGEKYLER